MEHKVTIEDKHASLEVAELAKNFGFNETIDTCYFVDLTSDSFIPQLKIKVAMSNSDLETISSKYAKYISAPTQQLLVRWLMNKHNYYIVIIPTKRYHMNIGYVAFKGFVFNGTGGPTLFDYIDDDYDKVVEEAFKYIFKIMK